MSVLILLLVVAIVGLAFWAVRFGGRLPKAFRGRSCQGRGWRSAFPSASKQQIREFLSLFVTAFAFNEREKLKLNPSDPLLRIYRALYPHRWQPDALEFETLSHELRSRYALDFAGIWNEELTLGELFAHTLNTKARVQ
jgi:hypothetical protein